MAHLLSARKLRLHATPWRGGSDLQRMYGRRHPPADISNTAWNIESSHPEHVKSVASVPKFDFSKLSRFVTSSCSLTFAMSHIAYSEEL